VKYQIEKSASGLRKLFFPVGDCGANVCHHIAPPKAAEIVIESLQILADFRSEIDSMWICEAPAQL